MRIKAYYNKTLNMSKGKIASQIAHAVAGLHGKHGFPYQYNDEQIIVLMASYSKLTAIIEELDPTHTEYYIQRDLGLTEVQSGTVTALAYLEYDK